MASHMQRCAFVVLALLFSCDQAISATVSNKDNVTHSIELLEQRRTFRLSPGQSVTLDCGSKCTVRLNGKQEDEYEVEASEIVSIEDGYLYYDDASSGDTSSQRAEREARERQEREVREQQTREQAERQHRMEEQRRAEQLTREEAQRAERARQAADQVTRTAFRDALERCRRKDVKGCQDAIRFDADPIALHERVEARRLFDDAIPFGMPALAPIAAALVTIPPSTWGMTAVAAVLAIALIMTSRRRQALPDALTTVSASPTATAAVSAAIVAPSAAGQPVSRPSGYQAHIFASLYVLLMVPTYTLPYLGSNSAFLNAAGSAAGAGVNPGFWVHAACLGLLIGLGLWRGQAIGKDWLGVYPALALMFDLVPALNYVPFVPTVMHLIAIIVGVSQPSPVAQRV